MTVSRTTPTTATTMTALGSRTSYLGEYVRTNGEVVSGSSLADLVAAADADLDREMQGKLSNTMMALGRIKTAAEAGFAYDQMLERGNSAGGAAHHGRGSTVSSTRPERLSASSPHLILRRLPSRAPTALMIPKPSSSNGRSGVGTDRLGLRVASVRGRCLTSAALRPVCCGGHGNRHCRCSL